MSLLILWIWVTNVKNTRIIRIEIVRKEISGRHIIYIEGNIYESNISEIMRNLWKWRLTLAIYNH